MENIVDNLNYIFNLQLHRFDSCMRERLTESERRLAVAWINKLKSLWNSVEEARLRNEMLYHLLNCCEEGCLKPPFHQDPPQGGLFNIRSILPAEMKSHMENAPPQSQPRAEIFQRSPDKGAFLASQPVPRSGAFCYLAIVSRAPNNN